MKKSMDRRDFNQLTAAALGGMVAGSALGCGKPAGESSAPEGSGDAGAHEGSGDASDHDHDAAAAHDASLLVTGKNVCRGLNHTCGGHKGGDNKCAGTGSCATAAAHSCHAANECKGEGGCGQFPGQNACKGKGECAVPLGDKAWETARAAFEKAMTDAGKKFGEAPPKG